MKIIILGAGKENDLDVQAKKLKMQQLNRLMRMENIDVHFIGGSNFEYYLNKYPNFKYYYNKDWRNTGPLYSLNLAKELFDGTEDIIILYNDILFSSELLLQIMKSSSSVSIAAKKIKGVTGHDWSKIEKVEVSEDGNLAIGKTIKGYHQFLGIIKVKSTVQKQFKKELEETQKKYEPINEALNFEEAYLTDFIYSYAQKYEVDVCEVTQPWVEMENSKEINKFIFGTKAETLTRLKKEVLRSKILDQVCITVGEWRENFANCLQLIKESIVEDIVVVRSSTFAEDGAEKSHAGAFESVLNINKNDENNLIYAINKVIASYVSKNIDNLNENQILIQPQVKNVEISGVVMTRDLTTGAPYYTLNYDDETTRTDTITSGSHNLKTMCCLKGHINKVRNLRLKQILVAAKEIENIVGLDYLDIEFAATSTEIYILQVRLITTVADVKTKKLCFFESYIQKEQKKYNDMVKRVSLDLCGQKSIFANMPDWNPAEIIGVRPKPLAYSLYNYLIMKDVWRKSREECGYYNPINEVLMYQFCGQPYVDTRVSFNTFLPSSLDASIKGRLIDFYIRKLEQNPELHDKVEFSILYTCYDFTTEERIQELLTAGFTEKEVEQILESLLLLTNDILKGKKSNFEKQMHRLKLLENKRKFITNNNKNKSYVIRTLLEDCKLYGTLPFSNLARCGFMAMSFLKSLEQINTISSTQIQNFLSNIETVASESTTDLNLLSQNKITKDKFLKKYGHLRPGTYDIMSPNYKVGFDNYFTQKIAPKKVSESLSLENLFRKEDLKNIDKLLNKIGLQIDAKGLFDFIEKSIVGREFAKYEFTKNLSLVLDLIEEEAYTLGFSKEDIQYLTIDEVINDIPSDIDILQFIIEQRKKHYEQIADFKLPAIIKHSHDFYTFTYSANKPNYITNLNVNAEVVLIQNMMSDIETQINNKIVVIENADPGYDWIFSYPIKGLITKYGGANSHMAIRCAEFNIPAAIGCGDVIYNNILKSRRIVLKCGEETIEYI